MNQYEIRILRADGSLALIAADNHLTDSAAIRAAEKIAHGRKYEVWRNLDCIIRQNRSGPDLPN